MQSYLKCEEVRRRRRRKCQNHGPCIKYVHFTSIQINPKSGSPPSCAESHLMCHIHFTHKIQTQRRARTIKKSKIKWAVVCDQQYPNITIVSVKLKITSTNHACVGDSYYKESNSQSNTKDLFEADKSSVF
jgi:hypothetical protein